MALDALPPPHRKTLRCLGGSLAKRTLDLTAAGTAIVLLSPVLGLIALAVRLDSPGPVFFRQRRIGRNLRPFLIIKFRTMVDGASCQGRLITVGADPRITPLGRFLRKSKLDELPQLVNVIRGDMSLVGPRPEVPRYVEMFRKDFAEILSIRPGITDLASLEYRDEASLLAHAQNPERVYVERVLPHKIRLARQYLHQSSFLFDLRLIIRTLVRVVWCPKRSIGGFRTQSPASSLSSSEQG